MGLALADNPRTAIKAAIKRASAQARANMNRLDREALGELDAIYRRAADTLAQSIRGYADSAGSVRLEVLQRLLGDVNTRIDQLAGARDQLVDNGLLNAAELGVRPFAEDTRVASSLSRVAHEAVQFVHRFVDEDGLQLSGRLWRLDNGARQVAAEAIQSAVIQGHGASQAATELLARGESVPANLQSLIQGANADKIAGRVTQGLLTSEGNPRYNALRLMRTELNRAHGEAYMAGGEEVEDFAGWRFLLSPRHPQTDICDMHARANLYGLGPGVYPSRQRCPWPAHPNTLSYVEIVFLDEITQEDRAGQVDPISWLKSQPQQVQEGVLGSRRKRAALDAGLLTKNQIRTPWRVLKKRYERAGFDTDQLLPPPSITERGETLEDIYAEAVDYVRAKGERSGWEYAVGYDRTTRRELMRKTSKAHSYVKFSAAELAHFYDARNKIDLVHNHPNSSSLSFADLGMGSLPGIHKVIAVGHDGTRFSARTVSDAEVIKRVESALTANVHDEVMQFYRDGKLTDNLSLNIVGSHLQNRVLHRLGLIDYAVETMPAQGALALGLKAVGENAIEEAAKRIEAEIAGRFF